MYSKKFSILCSICLISQLLAISISGQIVPEKRPFDFSDDQYKSNGVQHDRIIERRNGFDKLSVPDFIQDRRYRNVRIIGTIPVGTNEGSIAYAVEHGRLNQDGFTNDRRGNEARSAAFRYPIYTFPSEYYPNKKNQHDIIRTDSEYFLKNPLGLSVEIEVVLTEKGRSKEGQEILRDVLGANGRNLDRGFMLKTANEVERLTWMGLLNQSYRWDGRDTQFLILTLFKDPTSGTIARDAFLIMTRDDEGNILQSEKMYSEHFECLRTEGSWC